MRSEARAKRRERWDGRRREESALAAAPAAPPWEDTLDTVEDTLNVAANPVFKPDSR